MGALGSRLGEGLDSVADRFHTGHRGAPARERAHQEPRRDGRRGDREGRGHRNGNRAPAMQNGLHDPYGENGDQAENEQVGRHEERSPRLAHAPEVDEGDDGENGKAAP